MNKIEIFKKASQILNVSVEDMKYEELTENNAIYFWNPIRGGGAVIINNDGSYLYANSSVNFNDHLQEFLNGRRS